SQPMDLAVATYAHRGYVADDDSVSVVDTTSHRLLSTVPTGLTDQTAISLVQAGSKVYVGSFTSRHLAILDPASDTVTGTVRVGAGTTDIADVITPRGEFAYVTQYTQKRSRVTIVNARTDRVVAHVHVAGDPVAAAQAPGLGQVWIGTDAGENVQVLDPG